MRNYKIPKPSLEEQYLGTFGRPLLLDIQTKGIAPCMDAIEKKIKEIWMKDRELVPFILCVKPPSAVAVVFRDTEHSRRADLLSWRRLALAVHHQGIKEYMVASEVWHHDSDDYDKIAGAGVQIAHYTIERCTIRHAMIKSGKKVRYLGLPFEQSEAGITADCNPRFRAWATVAEVAEFFGLDRLEMQQLWDAASVCATKPLEMLDALDTHMRRLFHRTELGLAYNTQQKRLHKTEKYFAASYMEMQSKASGLVRSVCTWAQGSPDFRQALPRTEYIAFVSAGADGEPTLSPPKVMLVPWGHVESSVGHLMKPMGMNPERYYIERWPDADELAKLQEYEPDEIIAIIKAENHSTPEKS